MKIIDLLNKIANGEEVPDNFKYREYLFYYDEYNNCYFEEGHKNLFDILAYLKGCFLNDEVEVIEDNKKIEKLEFLRNIEYGEEILTVPSDKMIINKINEIIGVLNDKD